MIYRFLTDAFSPHTPKCIPSLDNLLEIEKRACDELVALHPHLQYIIETKTAKVPVIDDDKTALLEMGIYVLRFFHSDLSSPHQSPKHILLIHGINSGPLYFVGIIPHLVSLGFDVCCLSIPSCGGSVCDDAMLSMDTHQVIDVWVRYLYQTVCALFPNQRPSILAHSYGTHMVSCFAEKHSNILGKIIMCDAYGVAPHLGKYGYYVGLCMRVEYPNYYLKKLGRLWNAFAYMFSHKSYPVKHKYYSDQLIGTVGELFGEKIFKKHISFPSLFSAYNNIPVFDKLVSLKHNDLVFIWSDNDPITPAHNGLIVHYAREKMRKAAHTPRFYLLKNGGHNPIYLQNGDTLNAVISHIFSNVGENDIDCQKTEENVASGSASDRDRDNIPDTLDDCANELMYDDFLRNIDNIFSDMYATCWISQTAKSINTMYDKMLEQIHMLTDNTDTSTTIHFVDEQNDILPKSVDIRDIIYEK